jgi:hypothetical protein
MESNWREKFNWTTSIKEDPLTIGPSVFDLQTTYKDRYIQYFGIVKKLAEKEYQDFYWKVMDWLRSGKSKDPELSNLTKGILINGNPFIYAQDQKIEILAAFEKGNPDYDRIVMISIPFRHG